MRVSYFDGNAFAFVIFAFRCFELLGMRNSPGDQGCHQMNTFIQDCEAMKRRNVAIHQYQLLRTEIRIIYFEVEEPFHNCIAFSLAATPNPINT
eukprot:4859533-Pleurochrysis_carterae.AAC.1